MEILITKRERARNMYQTGDKVVYGNVGVCKVLEISELDFMDDHKMYYTLQPYYDDNRTIYAPLEGHKHKIRPMISKEEAESFIEKLPTIEPGNYENEKERKEAYRDVILSGDMTKWASMIHYIYRREQQRAAKGQKISAHYLEEMRGVERLLLGELAAAMDIPFDQMKDHIVNQLA